ncbi:MAG: fucose isomerase [Eubacteriales bacterium]|nr:fucose isomerase [Eubacteriales bacterium]
MKPTTLGIIVTNRSFFPDHLVTEERNKVLNLCHGKGIETIILTEQQTRLGAVETYDDAKTCASLFQTNRDRIDGILVILPNFGDEVGVATAIDLAKLNVPILIQACDDELNKMQLENRRDAFCGKISLCNNLYQRDIKYTTTRQHTSDLNSAEFSRELDDFTAVCRVVNGVRTARIAAIGARPDAFHTVRFSEKLLQKSGITTSVVDLSEIIVAAQGLPMSDLVKTKIDEIKAYGTIPNYIEAEKIILQAKLNIVLENYVTDHDCQASAIQCWESIQKNYGVATCLAMSMMGEKGMPSACEMDVTGALSMYALYLASGSPSAYFDWNNNFANERNKCVNLHCSNFPASFFGREFEIENLDVLGTTLGASACFGACKAQIVGGPMTFCKITTDDKNGKIKLYVGEGEFLDDPVDTKGGVSVCNVNDLQGLLQHITRNGFEHHVAMNRANVAGVLEEALGNYLGWDVHRHN